MKQSVEFLYAVNGAIVILFYVPQIWALWKDRSGAQSISIKMWAYWSFSQCIGIAYMRLVAQNQFLMTFSVGHLLGCGAIALLAAWRRRGYRTLQDGSVLRARRRPPVRPLVRRKRQALPNAVVLNPSPPGSRHGSMPASCPACWKHR